MSLVDKTRTERETDDFNALALLIEFASLHRRKRKDLVFLRMVSVQINILTYPYLMSQQEITYTLRSRIDIVSKQLVT